jgi:cytochrome c peroxidase
MSRALGLAIVLAAAAACSSSGSASSGSPPAPARPYPPGPYGTALNAVLENRTLDGVDATGKPTKIAYGDLRNKPIVIRVVAAFCGTCRADAEHGADALPQSVRDKANVIDVIVRDEDATLPNVDTAVAWAKKQDVHTAVVVDPAMTLVVDNQKLPRVLVVEPDTMTIKGDLSDPSPAALEAALGLPADTAPLVDGRFTTVQWDMIKEMVMTGLPPADPTNAVSDLPKASIFGKELFDDKGLGPSTIVSCSGCHEEDRLFTDGANKPTRGVGFAQRNTPTVIFAAWARWQFWDGRADSLWQQALGPLENPDEFASSRLWVVHRIDRNFRPDYEAVFGPMPLVDDPARFPGDGKPGDPAWEKMAPADQEIATRIFVNVGKAIAAFERTIAVLPNAVDNYANGQATALTDAQKDGLKAFFDVGCAQCHWGPRLTDDSFHNLRFPSGHDDFTPDNGRIEGSPKYDASEFRADSKWSDALPPLPRRNTAVGAEQLGAFKTPPIRGAPLTSPYGHGGGIATLQLVLDMHRTRGMPADSHLTTGKADPWAVSFDDANTAPLLELLQILDFAR